MYASIGVKGRLQEDRLIAAVLLLLQAFPAPGAELELQGVPSLDLRNPASPQVLRILAGGLSRGAVWPNGQSAPLKPL